MVDDEVAVRRILTTRLTMIGYEVITAVDGQGGLDAFAKENPDLIVLDVMMPNGDGYYVCQEIRKTSDVPIIMLTALGDVADRITGLQFGADDYLVKPFSPKELEVRIHCIFRRLHQEHYGEGGDAGVVKVADLEINTDKKQVRCRNKNLHLTNIEYDLLQLLLAQSGKPLSRSRILKDVWGYEARKHGDLRVVDVHISRLRSKIEVDPKQPEFIITERGIGYLFRRVKPLSEAVG